MSESAIPSLVEAVADGVVVPIAPAPEFLSMQNLLDVFLQARRQHRDRTHVSSGWLWRGSDIGYCLRSQWMRAMGFPSMREIDGRSLRVFAMGDIVEWWLRSVFADLGILQDISIRLESPELRCGGLIDLAIGGEVSPFLPADCSEWKAELLIAVRTALVERFGWRLPLIIVEAKSKNSRSFHYARKKGGSGIVAGEHQLLQHGLYRMLAEDLGHPIAKARWIVASVSKDDLSIAEDVVTANHVRKVRERLVKLNNYYDSGELPPCTCKSGDLKWMRNYCNYAYDGGCCGESDLQEALDAMDAAENGAPPIELSVIEGGA